MERLLDLTCALDGCERPPVDKGFCAAHGQRVRRTGSPGSVDIGARAPKRKTACSAPDCAEDSYCKGLCTRHYQRQRRQGTLELHPRRGADHQSWQGEDVTYRGLHSRLVRTRGPADRHACVDCGGRASQWSYDNADPDAKVSEINGHYSLDLDRYEPRCRPCHRAFDCRTSSTHVHNARFCFHTAA